MDRHSPDRHLYPVSRSNCGGVNNGTIRVERFGQVPTARTHLLLNMSNKVTTTTTVNPRRRRNRRKRLTRAQRASAQTAKQLPVTPPWPGQRGYVQPRARLSPCSQVYLRSLIDPWFVPDELPCIPDMVDAPSSKTRTIVRGSFTIGTQGFGFVAVNPLANTNDSAVGTVTGSTFASSVTTHNATGTVSILDTQFPYTSAAVTNYATRTVACGLRVRYMGTTLNMGGRMVLLSLPMHTTQPPTDLLNGLAPSQLLGNQGARTEPTSRRWSSVMFLPGGNPASYNYADSAINATSGASMIVAIDGANPGNTYEYELVYYREIIAGQSTPSDMTASHTDLPGLSAIKDYLGRVIMDVSSLSYKAALKSVEDALTYATSQSGITLGTSLLATYVATRGRPRIEY